MRQLCQISILTVLLALAACASHTKIAEGERIALNGYYQDRTFALRHSCFFGDMYDENEMWLLSPHAFTDVHHINDLEGKPIRPKGQRGVLPAGTLVKVEGLEFPDAMTLSRRMLTTPRYNPWVFVQLLEAEASPKAASRPLVLVLPMGIPNDEAFKKEMANYLGRPEKVSAWMEQRQPTIRVAIEHKEVVPEMTTEELEAAAGPPLTWLAEKTAGGIARVAWYPTNEVWMMDGKVTEVKPARKLEPPRKPKPEKKASEPQEGEPSPTSP